MTPEGDFFAQARNLFQAGRTAEATDLLERAVETRPNDLACRYALAVCLNEEKAWKRAETHLRMVIEAEPHHYLASYELGKALQGQRRLGEAAQAYRRCLLHGEAGDARRRLKECETSGAQPVRGDLAVPEDLERLAALAVLDADRYVPPPASLPTLADDLDERGSAPVGDLVWSSRTQLRAGVPAAVFATALALAIPALLGRNWLYLPLGAYAVTAWAAAFLISRASRFDFYERRLDVAQGIVPRSKQSIWYASITQVNYSRGLLSYLTHTASLDIHYMVGSDHKSATLAALGNPARIDRLYRELQGPVVRERRAMKKILF
ncbi:tetratricopeptide repeat protein [Streptomyces sp. NPDC088810]|uniref:tetratricopeptide repeat protein n=1 Tax=Streptomyces sp. NPDC088810 TaxID=3365904 RepID=UPI0037F9C3E2